MASSASELSGLLTAPDGELEEASFVRREFRAALSHAAQNRIASTNRDDGRMGDFIGPENMVSEKGLLVRPVRRLTRPSGRIRYSLHTGIVYIGTIPTF